MRRITTLVLLGLAFTATTAQAGEAAPQAIFKVKGTAQISPKWDIGTFGSVFLAPGTDPIYFYYLGPGLQATPGWWTSARIGLTIGLPKASEALPVISWWNYLATESGRLSLFTETEIYPSLQDGTVIYYGFYSVDYRLSRALSLGVHGEQLGTYITFGPHVDLELSEHLSTGFEYHWAGPGSDHVARVTMALAL